MIYRIIFLKKKFKTFNNERRSTIDDLVYLRNEEAVCDSLQVAEKFEKRHADVIRVIKNIIKNDSTQNCVRCFKEGKE